MATSHAAGATVQRITLVQKFSPGDYTLVPGTGTITEVTEFGAGNAVLVTYTTEFTMPRKYPLALHASPELDETSGEWTGKDLVPGTYTVSISGYRDLSGQFNSEMNFLFAASPPATKDFLVGGATVIEPYALIEDSANCYRCHTDIYFHEGKYRGFETCISCHGQAGSGDLPRYVAANAPATSGVTVNFRTLLHQIHRGREYANAGTFAVVAAGPSPYPNNFAIANFAEYEFPAIPGATMHCAKCHGDTNTAWLQPAVRDHLPLQGVRVLAWTVVCEACHATPVDLAHFQDKTIAGDEQCKYCHTPSGVLPVAQAHKTR
jgi:OmcA/MtrC family decaheme c-type cytochrome